MIQQILQYSQFCSKFPLSHFVFFLSNQVFTVFIMILINLHRFLINNLLLVFTGVNQKVLPVLSTETLLHIWLSTEYYGFRPSSTAVDTGDTRCLMMSK